MKEFALSVFMLKEFEEFALQIANVWISDGFRNKTDPNSESGDKGCYLLL